MEIAFNELPEEAVYNYDFVGMLFQTMRLEQRIFTDLTM